MVYERPGCDQKFDNYVFRITNMLAVIFYQQDEKLSETHGTKFGQVQLQVITDINVCNS